MPPLSTLFNWKLTAVEVLHSPLPLLVVLEDRHSNFLISIHKVVRFSFIIITFRPCHFFRRLIQKELTMFHLIQWRKTSSRSRHFCYYYIDAFHIGTAIVIGLCLLFSSANNSQICSYPTDNHSASEWGGKRTILFTKHFHEIITFYILFCIDN